METKYSHIFLYKIIYLFNTLDELMQRLLFTFVSYKPMTKLSEKLYLALVAVENSLFPNRNIYSTEKRNITGVKWRGNRM